MFPASLRQRSSAWVLLWASYKGSETEHLSKGEHHFHVCIRVCTSLKLYAYTTYCICITVVYCEMTIKMNGTSATTASSTNMLDSSWCVGFLWSSHCKRLSNLSPWARPPAAPLLLPATPNAFTFTWERTRKKPACRWLYPAIAQNYSDLLYHWIRMKPWDLVMFVHKIAIRLLEEDELADAIQLTSWPRWHGDGRFLETANSPDPRKKEEKTGLLGTTADHWIPIFFSNQLMDLWDSTLRISFNLAFQAGSIHRNWQRFTMIFWGHHLRWSIWVWTQT